MKKYLLLLLLICAFVTAKSQSAGTVFPQYVDVNPDTLLNYVLVPTTSESFFINMFDVINAVEIRANGAVSPGGTAAFINVVSLNPALFVRWGRWDSVYIPDYTLWNVTSVAKPLIYGDSLNPFGAVWTDSMAYLTDHSGYGGGTKNVNDWITADRYIGLKYQNGGELYYGWIRVQCVAEDACYIKDYSYMPLIIGMNERKEIQSLVYPNPVKDFFYLRNISVTDFDFSRLKLRDLYGREVAFKYEMQIDDLKINLSGSLAEGCYILEYDSNDQHFSRKFIIMN